MHKRYRLFIVGIAILLLLLLSLFALPSLRREPVEMAQPIAQVGLGGIFLAGSAGPIATSPELPGVMLAGSDQAGGTVLYSLDGGRRWQAVQNLPYATYYTPNLPALLPGDAPGSARFLLAGVEGWVNRSHAVFSSAPGQDGWSRRVLPRCPGGYSHDIFTALAVSLADPRRVYATRYCHNQPLDEHDGFLIREVLYEGYASPDGGRSFQRVYRKTIKVEQGIREDFLQVPGGRAPSPIKAERVYQGAEQVSEDGGRTWVATNFPGTTLVLDGVDADRLYGFQQTESGAVGMTRARPVTGWKQWAEQPCTQIAQLVAHPTQSGVRLLRCGPQNINDPRSYPGEHALFRSTDAGEHWQRLSEWSGQWIGPDFGILGRVLWARADGLWATTDLGDTWSLLTADYLAEPEKSAWENHTPPNQTLSAVVASVPPADAGAPGQMWVADVWGELAHWDSQDWRRVPYPHEKPVKLNGMAFRSSRDGWLVGEYNSPDTSWNRQVGVVYHWDGKTWTQSGPMWDEALNGVAVFGEHAWAVGTGGLLLHWDGAAWKEMVSPVRNTLYEDFAHRFSLNSIQMLSKDEGWAAGGVPYNIPGMAVILHYKDGVWTKVYDSESDNLWMDLASIHMLSASQGWATGSGESFSPGYLLHWDGQAWHIETKAVDMIPAVTAGGQTAWAGGHENFLRWDGRTWAAVDLSEDLNYDVQSMANLPDGRLCFSVELTVDYIGGTSIVCEKGNG